MKWRLINANRTSETSRVVNKYWQSNEVFFLISKPDIITFFEVTNPVAQHVDKETDSELWVPGDSSGIQICPLNYSAQCPFCLINATYNTNNGSLDR